ncbi:MAG: hypothetical protein TREMPRED_004862, partial [Tremellales sp. Tagirdzhanova-0007]
MEGEVKIPPIPIPAPSGPPPILLDSLLLIALRFVYFLLARRFLLSTLNPTLRDLSTPDSLLPLAASLPSASRRGQSDPQSQTGLPLLCEIDTEDENPPSRTTPNVSYPPSPSRSPFSPPLSSQSSRDTFTRRNTDETHLHPSNGSSFLPPTPDVGNSVELQTLGQKLKDVGSGVGKRVHVLQLSHGRRSDGGGIKGIKKATRGLSRLARALFSLCFAESCNLITLVVLHSLGVLHSRSLHVNFSISLHVLLAMILLVVPLVQCMLLTYRSRESITPSTAPRTASIPFTSRLLISLIPFSLYCFLWTRIPPYITALSMASPTPSLSSSQEGIDSELEPTSRFKDAAMNSWSSGPEGWEGGGWLAPSLGRVVVLGVVVLGGLSGLGAVRSAWEYIEHAVGKSSRALTDNDVLQAERSLYRVRQDLVAKREELGRLGATDAGSASGRGWIGRVFGGKEDQAVQAELLGLQAIESQVSRSLLAMKARKKRQEF